MLSRIGSSESKIIFDKKLVIIDADVTALYRGFYDMVPMIYTLPVILGGIFGRNFPDKVSIWDVRNHKTTNLSPDYYFASMTTSQVVAKLRGDGDYLQIDPALFKSRIIDVNKSFSRRGMSMPSIMHEEAEQIAAAIPYCAIDSLTFQGVTLRNPFYIANTGESAVAAFTGIYEEYLNFLHDKFNHALADGEEEQRAQAYVVKYLDFYAKYYGQNNPFAMSVGEFAAQHPQFGAQLLSQHRAATATLFQNHETLAEIALRLAGKVFSLHPYCQDIPTSKPECKTVFDDEYARPQFE